MTGEYETEILRPRLRLPSYAIFALILGIVLRIFAIFSAPVHSQQNSFPAYNDEASHLNHVLYRVYGSGQPDQRFSVTDENALKNGEVEYYQPPLYYVVMALAFKVFNSELYSVFLLRLLSLLSWLAALYILSLALPDPHLKGLMIVVGSLLGAGFIPSATINNDAFYALAVAGIYFLSIRNSSPLQLLSLFLLAALAIWIKLAALTLIPMVFFSLYVFKKNQGDFIKKGFLAGFVLLWTTIPLWLQRIDVYGHPLSLGTGGGEHLGLPLRELTVSVLLSAIQPWYELWFCPWVKVSAILLPLLTFGIMFYGFVAIKKQHKKISEEINRFYLPIWGVGALFATLGWIYYGIRFNQMETRLLLGAAPGLVLLLGWPVTLMKNRLQTLTGWALTLILAVSFISWS